MSTINAKMLMSFDFRPAATVAAVVLALAAPVSAADIGLVAPKSGAYDLLGRQMHDGAAAAAKALGLELAWIDETCEPDSGAAIAEELKKAGVRISVGYLCSESLDGALPALKSAGIPAITVSVRAPILMEDALKYGWPLFRLAPAKDAELEKLLEVMLRDWAGSAFAMAEDGTIHARELVEALRNRLEERGMKPAFLDTYRPGQEQQVALVRRFQKAGITHVLIGGDRNDVAIIARDAAAEGLPLEILAIDTIRAADQPVPLLEGVKAVALPPYPVMPAARDAVAALAAEGKQADGYALPSFAAVQVAAAAISAGVPAVEALLQRRFETAIGQISFNSAHELTDNPYRLVEWRSGHFVESPPGQ